LVAGRTSLGVISQAGVSQTSVDQIGDGAWGLFAGSTILNGGEKYTARLRRGICGVSGNCTTQDVN
jgi:hypothetical protein